MTKNHFSKKIICYSDKLANFPKKYAHKIELINPLVSKVFYEVKKTKEIKKKRVKLFIKGIKSENGYFY